jgi:glycosyltransferase involved in cell wall biosynthesis
MKSFSILIPVFNHNINDLVSALLLECNNLNIDFEIIVIDDKSTDHFKTLNIPISSISKVNYIQLAKNIGRSKIRNLLAQSANFELLIFLDCDSSILDGNFIRRYLDLDDQIMYGGTKYLIENKNHTNALHWNYGDQYEALDSNRRNLDPYLSFKTNNFAIKKEIFQSIKFNEDIHKYGHEDTLFAIEAKQKGFKILHLDNPVSHDGLSDNQSFLSKNKEAIFNLIDLNKKGFFLGTRLENYGRKFNQICSKKIKFEFLIHGLERLIISHSNTLIFQIWKALFYISNSK